MKPLEKYWADVTKTSNPLHGRLPIIARQQVYLASDVDPRLAALVAVFDAAKAITDSHDVALIVTESTVDAETMEETPTRVTQDYVNELWNQLIDAIEAALAATREMP